MARFHKLADGSMDLQGVILLNGVLLTLGKDVYHFTAESALDPAGAGWPVTSIASVDTDSNNSEDSIRAMAIGDGFGMKFFIPEGKTKIIIQPKGRARTAPGAPAFVGLEVQGRNTPDNDTIPVSFTLKALADVDIPTNELFQYDSEEILLTDVGLEAGRVGLLEFIRRASVGSPDLGATLYDVSMLSIRFS